MLGILIFKLYIIFAVDSTSFFLNIYQQKAEHTYVVLLYFFGQIKDNGMRSVILLTTHFKSYDSN